MACEYNNTNASVFFFQFFDFAKVAILLVGRQNLHHKIHFSNLFLKNSQNSKPKWSFTNTLYKHLKRRNFNPFFSPIWISSWYFRKSVGGTCQLEFFSFFSFPIFWHHVNSTTKIFYFSHLCKILHPKFFSKKKFVIEWPKNNIHLSFLSYKETWLTWSNHLCCCWSNFGNVMHYHIDAYTYHCQ
jgi:hypothetical protein